jgi:DNA-binding NtrC family response regulator
MINLYKIVEAMGKRILVVDDDTIMRETLRDILTFEGFSVSSAEGGSQAISQLSNEPFDLVITDILMPQRDGLEVITEAKKNYPNMQIIAISGGGYISADAYLRMASDAGADDIISKPFDVDDFLRKVYRILGLTYL